MAHSGHEGTTHEAARESNPRIHDFVESFTVWMKETSAAAHRDVLLAASLVDLMKGRLKADLDAFVETELRLRAFERRAPDPEPVFKLAGNAD